MNKYILINLKIKELCNCIVIYHINFFTSLQSIKKEVFNEEQNIFIYAFVIKMIQKEILYANLVQKNKQNISYHQLLVLEHSPSLLKLKLTFELSI